MAVTLEILEDLQPLTQSHTPGPGALTVFDVPTKQRTTELIGMRLVPVAATRILRPATGLDGAIELRLELDILDREAPLLRSHIREFREMFDKFVQRPLVLPTQRRHHQPASRTSFVR